ncbi:MAG: RagB/SusD family nutrient uptake outer membrane protein [Tannerella sp.]|jgi:hypothetical protein|nr:RagB/SusD family nutrient uptake outer membrane protein [Tannerella sp.]
MITGCSDVLDKNDLSAISEQDVWNDEIYATAFVDKLHRDNIPGWDIFVSSHSDEAGNDGSFSVGELSRDGESYWPYSALRNCANFIDNIGNGSLPDNVKGNLKAQVLTMRALMYWRMVKRYGGIPMIMHPQTLDDDLLVTRNKTSECIELIIRDLDEAIETESFPMTWSGNNAGRLSKAAAMALKGRILLYWASPQFNPNNDAGRWTEAYNANKTARDQLKAAGYDLYESFENIWFDEMNKEVVLPRRYEYPNMSHIWDAASRPSKGGLGHGGYNQPAWELVKSFPMITGESVDESSTYDDVYFWKNRDPRLAKTIAWNGCVWELYGETGAKLWTDFEEGTPSATHMYCRKAINPNYTVDQASINHTNTDWIEIRYAEVLMNFAEAAAETGKSDEAYEVLKQIRRRAGIEAGSNGMYGLKANMNAAQMIDAIMLERKIEFAFEQKRYWDLRRRRLLQTLNGTVRHGRLPVLKEGVTREDVRNADMNTEYHIYFEDQLDVVDKIKTMNYPENYYFYAINNGHLIRNSNLQQTKGWDNGTFDPLQ